MGCSLDKTGRNYLGQVQSLLNCLHCSQIVALTKSYKKPLLEEGKGSVTAQHQFNSTMKNSCLSFREDITVHQTLSPKIFIYPKAIKFVGKPS